MMTKPQRLAWWRAYAILLAIVGGLCLAQYSPLPIAWRIGAQLAILFVIYMQLRCQARAARLTPVPGAVALRSRSKVSDVGDTGRAPKARQVPRVSHHPQRASQPPRASVNGHRHGRGQPRHRRWEARESDARPGKSTAIGGNDTAIGGNSHETHPSALCYDYS
jgi:hypothetical protein